MEEGKVCETCKYWDEADSLKKWGYCRRYAPRPLHHETVETIETHRPPVADWPHTYY